MATVHSQMIANTDMWEMFTQLQQRRRAIRDFSDRPVEGADIEAILASGALAPTSMGMQPYKFHVVTDPEIRKRMVEACNGQRAAKSAPVLVVIAVRPAINRQRIVEAVRYYREEADLPQKSRDYHAYRAEQAHIEKQWRRPKTSMVVEH